MNLRYQRELSEFSCELSNFHGKSCESFRWTFEDIDDIRNFQPVYINDPDRERTSCLGFALSFYTTKEAGIKRLRELTLNKLHLFKKLGTHIAQGQLNERDGIANEPNSSKHFDFFTYENVELKGSFSILESME